MLLEMDPRAGKRCQDFLHDVGEGVGGIIRHQECFPTAGGEADAVQNAPRSLFLWFGSTLGAKNSE